MSSIWFSLYNTHRTAIMYPRTCGLWRIPNLNCKRTVSESCLQSDPACNRVIHIALQCVTVSWGNQQWTSMQLDLARLSAIPVIYLTGSVVLKHFNHLEDWGLEMMLEKEAGTKTQLLSDMGYVYANSCCTLFNVLGSDNISRNYCLNDNGN